MVRRAHSICAPNRDIWYGKLVPNSKLLGKFGHYLETSELVVLVSAETTRFGTPQGLCSKLQ
jgi:hypothetical protein